jgi:hypothetical protein
VGRREKWRLETEQTNTIFPVSARASVECRPC